MTTTLQQNILSLGLGKFPFPILEDGEVDSVALAEDLLQQARDLARLGPSRPRQASLRRSISTAYYALFHLLVQDAARRLSPATPAGLAQQVARAFSHSDMKQVCKSISAQPTPTLISLHPQGFSPSLRAVALAFVTLQERRHDADYNLTLSYSRDQALNLVDLTQSAFADWHRIRLSDEANIFCAALLFHRTWGR